MKYWFFAALLAFAAAGRAADIPPLKTRVTDLTGTLNAQQRSALEESLAAFEASKGAQIAVLLVPTTQPETVEQYAVRVQESWKLGRKGVDDGVLLVVAKNDRRVKIEVGYGLEGILPDAVARRVIEDDIVPRFKQNDFYGGIRAGVDRMMRVIEGEKLPPPIAKGHPAAERFDPESWIGLLFIGLVVGSMLRPMLGRFLSSGLVGGVAGLVGWAIFGALIGGVIVGIVAFVLSLLGGFMPSRRSSGWGGGWSSGGGWGGGGWSSGGGGFSGGGGGSGGGGASGSW